ncbi:MAG: hypothetical protein U1E52_15795 [Geminicoccaceae bacterium]
MSPRTAAPTPLLELLLALISAVAILSLVAYLGYLGWQGRTPRPPEIAVELGGAQPLGTGWLVPFEAANHGDQPAGQITVELTAGDDRAETTLDFLAAHSSARGGFFLPADPGLAQMKARALGYLEP